MRDFRNYVPPDKPKRSPAGYRKAGWLFIALGFFVSAVGLFYMMHDGSMSFSLALVTVLPLFLIFAAFGWSQFSMGKDGLGVMVSYLSTALGACGFLAAWLFGK
jgi:hypothetical protein